jgi:hypothetical protein
MHKSEPYRHAFVTTYYWRFRRKFNLIYTLHVMKVMKLCTHIALRAVFKSSCR